MGTKDLATHSPYQTRIAFYTTASFSVILPDVKNILLALGVGAVSIELASFNGIRQRTLSRYHTLIIRTYLTCSVNILNFFGGMNTVNCAR